MQNAINIMIIGKTGAGKSSLCNYIFNETVFATGTGRPVTGWADNFASHSVEYDGYVLNVYDSVGIEANNLVEWKSKLDQFLDEKRPSSDKLPSEWLHAAIYVINASSSRIEEAELELIKSLKGSGIPVQVVFTNVDKCSDVTIEALKSTIKEAFRDKISLGNNDCDIQISEVCSVSIRKRSGTTNAHGKEETLQILLSSLDKELRRHIIKAFCDNLSTSTETLKKDILDQIKRSDLGLINLIKGFIKNGDNFDIEDLLFDIDKALEKSHALEYMSMLDAIESFTTNLDYKSSSDIKSSEIVSEIRIIFEMAMDNATDSMEKKFQEIEEKLQLGSKWDRLIAAGKVAIILADIKGFFIKTLKDNFDHVLKSIEASRIKHST